MGLRMRMMRTGMVRMQQHREARQARTGLGLGSSSVFVLHVRSTSRGDRPDGHPVPIHALALRHPAQASLIWHWIWVPVLRRRPQAEGDPPRIVRSWPSIQILRIRMRMTQPFGGQNVPIRQSALQLWIRSWIRGRMHGPTPGCRALGPHLGPPGQRLEIGRSGSGAPLPPLLVLVKRSHVQLLLLLLLQRIPDYTIRST